MKTIRAILLLAVVALGLTGAVNAASAACCPSADCCASCSRCETCFFLSDSAAPTAYLTDMSRPLRLEAINENTVKTCDPGISLDGV